MFEIDPVNQREVDGNSYTDMYNFDSVDIDRAIEQQYPDGCSLYRVTKEGKDGIRYQYKGRPPIFVTGSKVYALTDHAIRTVRNQAYFALSLMDERGCVSRWRKL